MAGMIASASAAAPKASAAVAGSALALFEPGTISFEWAKAMPTAVVTLVIGLLAFMVANGQRRISSAQRDIASSQREIAAARFKLDLFDRRLEVFDVVWALIAKALDGDATYSPPVAFVSGLRKG